ncbi:MAG TPA: hypothetical protein PLU55_00540 [Candidatus Pacearchaeota archaeon]|nr:hypothetical protein [Candidatus Pacearchaeota archaeon]
MIEFEDFIKKCESGFCLRQTIKSKRCITKGKQEDCYKKYILKSEKDVEKRKQKEVTPKWEELKREILIRDKNECRFYAIATKEEREVIDKMILENPKLAVRDGAHVLARSKCPEMIYDTDNVYTLYRGVHSAIDHLIDPITQKPMSYEQSQNYWKRIIGEQKYNELYERYMQIQIRRFYKWEI